MLGPAYRNQNQVPEQEIFGAQHISSQTAIGFSEPTNDFGESVLHRQSRGAVVLGSPVASAASVVPTGVVNQNASVHYNINGFTPLFEDEQKFNERELAKQETREISDYPYGNLPAQYDILRRLYVAFRNTIDVEDSAKVAAKFADGSYSELAYHEACWAVMVGLTPGFC
jgi:hypothetical protein